MAGMSAEQWKRVIDVSLHGFFHVTQPLLLPMARTRWGRIVSVSSVAAVLGNRGQSNYAAAKAALHGASKSLAREMASRSEEHTSELQSLMRISYAVFCLKKKKQKKQKYEHNVTTHQHTI